MMTIGLPLETPANVLRFAFPGVAVPEPEVTQPQPIVTRALRDWEIDVIREIADGGRDRVIKAIKGSLQQRSGKQWSVTGGRGTAYGWIRIDAPPARCTWKHVPREGKGECPMPGDENWEYVDCGEKGHGMSPSDQKELAKLMGLERIHQQGHSIPASSDYYRVALCQAIHGHSGPFTAEQYWD